MKKRLARIVLLLLGALMGVVLAAATLGALSYFHLIDQSNLLWELVRIILYVSGGLVGLLVAVILLNPLLRAVQRGAARLESLVHSTEPGDFLFGAVGVILGLTIAYLSTSLLSGLLPWIRFPISAAAYLILGYVGGYFGAKRWRDLPFALTGSDERAELPHAKAACKLLDTCAIIDGRVLDVARTGFIEGELLVPSFVLTELRHIADSSDDLRRKRGRRGLDILHALQQQSGVRVLEEEAGVEEVDSRLLQLAAKLGAAVITVDYNLNKVARVAGVPVLNINELARVVKPLLLQGERLQVHIVKEGKEEGQGVAYLDDGTMIVVDSARSRIGEQCAVVVTSMLQTAAGRMVFARLD